MSTQIEILRERLFGKSGMSARNFSIFPGSNPNAAPEDIAGEINKTLDEFSRGNFEEIADFED